MRTQTRAARVAVVAVLASGLNACVESQVPHGAGLDKDKILIELAQSPRTQIGNVAYEKQSSAQQVFSVIWALEGDVNNGGFAQYFSNSSGDTALHAESALRAIGAHKTADIAASAVAIFPGGPPPVDRAARQRRSLAAAPDVLSAWDRLDRQFFARPDDLTALLYAWVKQHPAEFGAVP